KTGAWWVRHHEQIPAIVQDIAGIADDVLIRPIVTGQQVAGPCVVAQRCKGATHGAGELTGDEDAESFGHHAAFLGSTIRPEGANDLCHSGFNSILSSPTA